MSNWDVIVVGGGAAGLAAAHFAARRGGRVLLLDHADTLGGSLWVATGQISAAGTSTQRDKGIADSAQEHFEDVMRISRGTADPVVVRAAVENAADTFEWLLEIGFRPLPDHPVDGFGHEPYAKSRYYWAAEGGIALKDLLGDLVLKQASEDALSIRLEHEVIHLAFDEEGGVSGVTARDVQGQVHLFHAKSVVLACGGYSANPEMFAQLNGFPQYTAQPYPYARGAGIRLGLSAGGYLKGKDRIYSNFGVLLASKDYPAPLAARVLTYPEMRQPWEIYVNASGSRFIREDMPSIDAREFALSKQENRRFWILFNREIFDLAPPLLLGWDRDQIEAAFQEGRTNFFTAPTLELLASKLGIPSGKLQKTVAMYNYGVTTGNDFFGREHLPAKIEDGPFFALRMQATATSSAVGIAVDQQFRVVRENGTPVANLYAAGEILGAAQTMGAAACGGMMVTPALTFGRMLGQNILPIRA